MDAKQATQWEADQDERIKLEAHADLEYEISLRHLAEDNSKYLFCIGIDNQWCAPQFYSTLKLAEAAKVRVEEGTYTKNMMALIVPMATVAAASGVLEAAQLKRNALIQDEHGFEGAWVAIPREDFDKLRDAVGKATGQ